MSRGSSHERSNAVERFSRLSDLFERARGRSEAERAALLVEVEGEDSALAAELRRLLARHDDPAGVLGDGAESVDADLVARALDEETKRFDAMPETIGPWRLERPIARGGMGAVFLARRAEGDFEQRVAIKVLRADLNDPDLVRRFRAERAILAGMRHPCIAALYDGGTLEDGRPYVVMEYVEGEELVAWADARGLTVRQRLELFRKVCSAVEHMHRALVVHRDLKPSNVLVQASGEPKVVDFGIAKLLAPELDRQSIAVTGTATMLFTPEYASPEQARGEPVTTASDVYSLGIVLYELLAGVRAHRFESRRPTELERVITGVDPPPPSEAARTADPPRSGAPLEGDLDNICLTAMRKEPGRRYGSVAELSEDVRRHLEDLPVRARADTWRYKASKFVRRNRSPVAAAALLALFLAAFAATMAVQADRFARQRDVARRESRVAGEVTEFLVGLFRTAEPEQSLGAEIRARELLDVGRRRIEHSLREEPLVRAELMHVMGRAYRSLGMYRDAEPLLEDALAARRELDADRGHVAASLLELGLLRHDQGDLGRAEARIREALAERLAVSRAGGAGVSEARLELARFLCGTGGAGEALELARAGLAARRAGGAPPAAVAEALSVVGAALQELARFEEAEAAFLEARDLQRDALPELHPDRARTERALGHLYEAMRRLDRAVECHERALALDRAVMGEGHPDVDADLFGLASALVKAGEYARALEIYEDVLERDRRRFDAHPHVALDLNNIAGVELRLGRLAEAEARYREALAMQRELLPPDHPEIATTLSNLGASLHRQGRLDEAAELIRRSLALRESAHPPDHPAVLTSRSLLAGVHHARGELAEAEAQYRAVLAARRAELGEHPMVAGSLYALAATLHGLERDEEAESLARESYELYRATLGPDHVGVARPAGLLGAIRLGQGRPAEAERYLREVVRLRAARLDASALPLTEARLALGRALIELARPDEAEEVLGEALAGAEAGGAGSAAHAEEIRRELGRVR